MVPLAHSARYYGKQHPYREHVLGVVKLAKAFLEDMRPFLDPALYRRMEGRLLAAAPLHDLGKLDDQNQDVLHDDVRADGLPIPHQYAGAWYFHKEYDLYSAALIYGHHAPGLPDMSELIRKPFSPPLSFGGAADPRTSERLWDHTQVHLQAYLDAHRAVAGSVPQPLEPVRVEALEERMLLSCLVDADWSDTGRKEPTHIPTRWTERREKLHQHVRGLEAKAKAKANTPWEQARNRLRHDFFAYCLTETDLEPRLKACEGPVGVGKTTSPLVHLLRWAEKTNAPHILIVLPLISILSQTEKVLKDALVLEEEDREQIVAVLHHRADYSSKELRELAAAWEAPIILTTAVGLFETLASNEPGALRKLHQLPGSALLLDEFHAAAPAACLPVIWQWLTQLTGEWGCSVLLSSGTTVRFWEDADFQEAYQGKTPSKHPLRRPASLLPASLQREMEAYETERVLHRFSAEEIRQCHFADCAALLDFVLQQPGPRVVLMDTRRAAAYAARMLLRRGEKVFHLSNAFAPEDVEQILKAVERALAQVRTDPAQRNFTLVATTMAGIGLNLSFQTGFCAAISCAAYLQLVGRINRNGEYAQASLWPFTLADPNLTPNPHMSISREVWLNMLQNGLHGKALAVCSPSELASFAYREECKRDFGNERAQQDQLRMERNAQFVGLAARFHLISKQPTVLAVVNPTLLELLQRGERCTGAKLQRGSVSIYQSEVDQLRLQAFSNLPQLYRLPPAQYDRHLLGYFQDLLP